MSRDTERGTLAELSSSEAEETRRETDLTRSDAEQARSDAEQTRSDADQTYSDADQTYSDADQTLSSTDLTAAESDQRASDRDQAAADRNHASHTDETQSESEAYELSREERASVSSQRIATGVERALQSQEREHTSTERDEVAIHRDAAAVERDAHSSTLTAQHASPGEAALLEQLEMLRRASALDRERAAADRARAARDRAAAAAERSRLEEELRTAHLDGLTGAYRREMGPLAIAHEIDRVRRSDGRLVVAFVDVDGLKAVNDREGHAAGDAVLQAAVHEIRVRLRSYDPIVRYGGDEFICVLTGATIPEAKRRFVSITEAIEAKARVGISVGFAALSAADTPERLIRRADSAMLKVKRIHHSRVERWRPPRLVAEGGFEPPTKGL